MQQSHLYILGLALAGIAVVIIVLAGGFLESPAQESSGAGSGTGGFSFSLDQRQLRELFMAERSGEAAPEAPTTPLATTATATQRATLDRIITDWETNAEGAAPETAPSHVRSTTTPTPATPEAREREEVRTLFTELLGPRISDTAVSQGSGYESLSNDALIWGGSYTSTQAPLPTPTQTPEQTALRTYANELGAQLRTTNLALGDQVGALEAFMETREAAGLFRIADTYVALADDIATLTAPAQATSVQAGLVVGYKAVGELLRALADARTDEAFVDALLVYNSAAEDVARHHVTLVTTLNAYGIVFQSHEAGSMFSFSPPQ